MLMPRSTRHQLTMRNRTSVSSEMLPGALEVLILKVLARGAAHGYAIARTIEHASADVLQVGESSLYPALQRLVVNGWAVADWGESELRRRARIYTITPAGRKRLLNETEEFARMADAIIAILQRA